MAGSTGSRFLWVGLLAPPLLVLGSAGAVMYWPERTVGMMDAVYQLWNATPPPQLHRNRMVIPHLPPAPPPIAPPTIRGMVRNPDGSPFRGRYSLRIVSQQHYGRDHEGREGGHGSGWGHDLHSTPEFAIQLTAERTWIQILPEDAAPTLVGPLSLVSLTQANAAPPSAGPGPAPPHGVGTAKPPGPGPTDAVVEPGFPFEVRVLDDAGSPIVGVEVAASRQIGGTSIRLPQTLHTLRTGDDGRVVFPHLQEGDYEFEPTVHAFRVPDDTALVRTNPGGSATITLERGPASGVALDEHDRPVPDAALLVAAEFDERVDVESTHPFQRIVLAKSDSEGRFSLPALHKDSVYLIRADGPDGSLGFAPGVRRGDGDLKITLRPLHMVRGVALQEPGGPPAQVSIRRSVPTGFDARGQMAELRAAMQHTRGIQVGPDGRFEFPAWGSVDTELRVFDRPVPVPWPPPKEPVKFEAPSAGQEERTVRLSFAADGAIRPIRGTMTLHLQNGPPERSLQEVVRQVEIRRDSAQFRCLMDESFRFDSAAIPGYWTAPGTIVGGGPPGDRMIDVRVFAAGSISGRVVDSDGSPVGEGTRIFAAFDPNWAAAGSIEIQRPGLPDLEGRAPMSQGMPRPDPTFQGPGEGAVTDADGRFEIPAWPLGVAAHLIVERGRFVRRGEIIRPDARDPRKKVEIRLPRKAGAAVHVVDPEGKPIPGAEIRVMLQRSGADQRMWRSGLTDADGRRDLDDLAEGEQYVLRIEFPADFRPIVSPLKPGSPTLELHAERGKVLEGRVVEAVTGWPIPKLELFARGLEPGTAEATVETDADGRFRMSTLPEGPVVIEDRRLMNWLSPQPQSALPVPSDPILIRLINLRTSDPQPRPVPLY